MAMSIAKSIDDYIAGYPKDVQVMLQKMRAIIKKAAPEAEEAIAYGIPTFKLNGNLVHFGGYKSHIGFYPAPNGIEAFRRELSKYEGSKGAIRFPLDKPLPASLITKVVKYRVAKNMEKVKPSKTAKATDTAKPAKTAKSAKPIPPQTDDVNEYMKVLKHPLKAEMEAVRKIIKDVNKNIGERIKWKAPSYHYNGADMVTFNAWADKNVHLVFHHPAVVKIKSGLLQGDYKDRRMMYFNSMGEVNAGKKELQRIIKELVAAIGK